MVFLAVCEAGGIFCEMMDGGVRHIPLQLILWEYPWDLKCFALTSLDQQELFNFPSNALFCILEIWQDFIRTVVLRLRSRGTNFHSNKNIRNYTQDGLVNFRFHT